MFALSGRSTSCIHATRRFRRAGDSVWAVRCCDAPAVQTPAQRLRGAGEGARLRLLQDVRPGWGTCMWSVHGEMRLRLELPVPTWGEQTTSGSTGGTGVVLPCRLQKNSTVFSFLLQNKRTLEIKLKTAQPMPLPPWLCCPAWWKAVTVVYLPTPGLQCTSCFKKNWIRRPKATRWSQCPVEPIWICRTSPWRTRGRLSMVLVGERWRASWTALKSVTYSSQEASASPTVTEKVSTRKNSAVRPKAEGGATAGVWTNMGSHYLDLTEESEARPSVTTWRANERKEDLWEEGSGQRKEQESTWLLHLDFCKHLKELWTFQVPFLSAREGRGKGWNLVTGLSLSQLSACA